MTQINITYIHTGHEHLGSFGIINMNGRIYDPNTASFFSPDPFVADASSTQAFNRYSYCLNNPLMYTDPTGEFIFSVLAAIFCPPLLPVAIGADIFGAGNLTTQIMNGNVDNFWKGAGAYLQGAAVGAYYVAPTFMTIYGGLQATVTTGSIIAGVGQGLQTGDWSGLGRAGKIALGNFALDENNFLGGILQGISRHTWEALTTTVGYGYTQIRNANGNVSRVDYFGGATFATNEYSGSNDGVSFGSFINVNIVDGITGSFRDRVLSDPLYMHEYGHTFDSRFNPFYLLNIGLPSLNSASKKDGQHKYYWTETRANRHTGLYFRKLGVNWNNFLDDYPFGR